MDISYARLLRRRRGRGDRSGWSACASRCRRRAARSKRNATTAAPVVGAAHASPPYYVSIVASPRRLRHIRVRRTTGERETRRAKTDPCVTSRAREGHVTDGRSLHYTFYGTTVAAEPSFAAPRVVFKLRCRRTAIGARPTACTRPFDDDGQSNDRRRSRRVRVRNTML